MNTILLSLVVTQFAVAQDLTLQISKEILGKGVDSVEGAIRYSIVRAFDIAREEEVNSRARFEKIPELAIKILLKETETPYYEAKYKGVERQFIGVPGLLNEWGFLGSLHRQEDLLEELKGSISKTIKPHIGQKDNISQLYHDVVLFGRNVRYWVSWNLKKGKSKPYNLTRLEKGIERVSKKFGHQFYFSWRDYIFSEEDPILGRDTEIAFKDQAWGFSGSGIEDPGFRASLVKKVLEGLKFTRTPKIMLGTNYVWMKKIFKKGSLPVVPKAILEQKFKNKRYR